MLYDSEGLRSIAPLDCVFGLSQLPFKMSVELMLRCAFWAQNQCSYQAAEDILLNYCHVSVNDDTIRLVTNFIGKLVFENDCRKVDEVFKVRHQKDPNAAGHEDGVLYIEMDGAALNTRTKNEDGSTWRENKLGCVFTSKDIHYWTTDDGERRHLIERRDYVSYLGDVETFGRHLYVCAVENGLERYKQIVVIGDGAPWIAHLAKELNTDSIRILDLYHLKENVYEFARAKFKQNEKKYEPWAQEICQQLEDGHWENVLAQLDENEKYPSCVNLYHYIYENRDAINYPEYRGRGYFVGSGVIESGNKVVLQRRLKQAGMRWEPESAQYLLTLKAKYESGRWATDVEEYIRGYFQP